MTTETEFDPREVFHVALLPRGSLTLVEYVIASCVCVEYADEQGRNATPDLGHLSAILDISEPAVRLCLTSLVTKGRLIETAPGTFDLALPDAVRRRGEAFIRHREALHARTAAGWEPTEDEITDWWRELDEPDDVIEAGWRKQPTTERTSA